MDRWTSGPDYDRWMGRWSRLVAREFLSWLDLPSGLRWLDICCGSGVLSEAIAELNAPSFVQGVDLSLEQINFARRHRARANLTFDVADAMALPFPEAGFDVAVCGLGLNYLPDPARALEEFQRVIRPGGTLAAYVWDYEHGARFLREFWDAAAVFDPEASSYDQARRFPMCQPAALLDLFTAAQLADVTTHGLEIVTRFTSIDDYWEPLLSGQGSAPNYLATREPGTRAKIRQRLKDVLPVSAGGSIELPARAWGVRGRRR